MLAELIVLAELNFLSRLDAVEVKSGDNVETTEAAEVGHAPWG
jgi:hypothetical protein